MGNLFIHKQCFNNPVETCPTYFGKWNCDNLRFSIFTATFITGWERLNPYAVPSTTFPNAPEPRIRPEHKGNHYLFQKEQQFTSFPAAIPLLVIKKYKCTLERAHSLSQTGIIVITIVKQKKQIRNAVIKYKS